MDLDVLERRSSRVLPAALGPPVEPSEIAAPNFEREWLGPCPQDLYASLPLSPEAAISNRESVALAFLVSLQALPPRQRVVLLLRDVVGLEASECATLLDTSIASINSALQRARETLSARAQHSPSAEPTPDQDQEVLLARYLAAWHAADVGALVTLLQEEATLAMPPISQWVQGIASIRTALLTMILPPEAAGQFRLVPLEANALPAFAAYQYAPSTGDHRPYSIHLLEIERGQIRSIVAFLDPGLFPRFGLPDRLSGGA